MISFFFAAALKYKYLGCFLDGVPVEGSPRTLEIINDFASNIEGLASPSNLELKAKVIDKCGQAASQRGAKFFALQVSKLQCELIRVW